MQTGDLLYWDDGGDGKMNHATIISGVDENGNLLYAGNTSWRFDQRVDEVFSDGEVLYIVRLKDCVFE